MEEEQKQTEFRRAWDACREVPDIQDESNTKKRLRFMKWLSCTIVGVLVFVLALFSKSSFLILVTLGSNSTVSIPAEHKPSALLGIGCVLVGPSVLLLLKSVWKFIFKSAAKPSKKTVLWVLTVESVVACGEVLLTVLAMPHFDIVTNVMILNSVSILSAVLQVAAECCANVQKRDKMVPLSSIIFSLLGYILFIVSYLINEDKPLKLIKPIGLAIFGTICVSLNWWENYSTLFKNHFLEKISEDIARTRNVVCILSSVVKILITALVVGVSVPPAEWLSLKSIPTTVSTTVFGLVAVQIASSAMCRWFAVVACKMHALRRCFVVPMYIASVAVLIVFLIPLVTFYVHPTSSISFCENRTVQHSSPQWLEPSVASLLTEVTGTLCTRLIVVERNIKGLAMLGSYALCWWLGLILGTVYIWFLKIQRIERTQDLFSKQMYEGAFLEQSMLLSTRFEIKKQYKESRNHEILSEDLKGPEDPSSFFLHRSDEPVTVYLCATMWHETYAEMMKIIISMFRLDKYRPKINKPKDATFEFHIYFDDAFKDVNKGKARHANEYAEILVEVIREVYTIFSEDDPCIFKKKPCLPQQKIISTPYGGRLEYTLPKGNTMMVHLKDKQLIRHKKRWSQIMYLYYILGWKLNRKYFKKFEEGSDKKTLREELKKEKENTYILALDGDTDFQPSAVLLLIDRLKLYPEVGAACGRIHPTGTGPMVWYQKFEYAVGHWLQKTAEHVFGCVLCSPGCFSLFRGAALMDDNVMKRYTTRATEASQYVQYDQGEDRWLCTLLLQQGWRVEYNAASDAYTNAPQDFKEFYNQRRRWGPSTMANTIDLLGSGRLTSKRNKSISKPYILYQVISMGASILGPATICLMIAGSFTFIMNMDPNLALLLATVPPTIYLILCFKLKSDTQIQIAAVMSILYAFLMTGTILSIIGDMVKQQTFMTPAGLFLISMTLMYLITAALHPQEFSLIVYGLLYFLCIPSGYLMLVIYSIVNMNNVTWGTRETGGKAKTAAVRAIKKQVMQATCCRCPCGSSTEDGPSNTHELLESSVPEQQDLKVPADSEDAGSRSHESQTQQSPKSWIEELQTKSDDFSLHTAALSEDEVEFWKELQKQYLEPLNENPEQQEKIAKDLKDLRNKVTFGFFICNAIWLVATMFLQAIGNSISLSIPKIYPNGTLAVGESFSVDPISLMFLLSFALLLFMQFFAMLYHRIYTLIHFVAYVDTESKAVQKQSNQKAPKALETSSHNKPDTSICIQNPAAEETGAWV